MFNDIVQPIATREVLYLFEIERYHSAFYFDQDENWVFTGERHDFWEVVFVTEGCVESTEDENVYLMQKNDIIIHAPLEFHSIRSAEGSCAKGFIFSFVLSGDLPSILKSGVFALSDCDAQKLAGILTRLIRFFHEETDDYCLGQYASHEISCFLIDLLQYIPEQRYSVQPDALLYQKVVRKMQDCLDQNLSLEQLARTCGISISYIKYIFHKYAAVSPKLFYSKLRIQQAINYMISGMTITEVSNRMHFTSPSYFSVFFKKQTGVSPSAYLKSMTHSEDTSKRTGIHKTA